LARRPDFLGPHEVQAGNQPAPWGTNRGKLNCRSIVAEGTGQNNGGLGPIIGIDLGTTHSSVGVFEAGKVRLLPNALGEVLTPSAVALDHASGRMVVGRAAKDIVALEPSLGALSFKRRLGSAHTYRVGSRQLSATELSAYVLDSLRVDAERALACSVNRCVISVPAYFAEPQRMATRQAASAAGLVVERLINEPTAAALAHGIVDRAAESTFMVFDLGGGTFDVCIMDLFDGVLQVKGVAGESQLGGEDFTAALEALALVRAGIARDSLGHKDAVTLNRRVELLKRKLSRWPFAELVVPGAATAIVISAEEADAAYAPLLERLAAPCRSALRGAGVLARDLHEVLLVGGATRMPCVQRHVQHLLGCPPTLQAEPDLTVARGATLHAGMCARDVALDDRVITDVASHSLGVEVAQLIGSRLASGRFSPIIERGTVLPVSRTELFATLERNQHTVELRVFEGEAREVKDNVLLGQLSINSIPPGSPRNVVEVTFTYDLSGILEVQARLIETGQMCAKLLARDNRTLQNEELELVQARIAQLKMDPAERPAYRELLARANVLWTDLIADDRRALDDAMRDFEAAMATRTPRMISSAETVLRNVCEHFEGGERW
jgi:molecular chaperone HscC